MINILCYGDSNTYGYIPGGKGRFDENIRWTGKLSKALEKKCHIIEEGVGGYGFNPEFDLQSEATSKQLAKTYESLAQKNGYYFLDASKYASPSEEDREHLDEEGHKKFADAVIKKLKNEIISEIIR